jgi:hypothetical protein
MNPLQLELEKLEERIAPDRRDHDEDRDHERDHDHDRDHDREEK